MGIEEGTVAALISRSLEGPGDIDEDDDVMGSAYVGPGVSPPCLAGLGPGGGSSVEEASYKVRGITELHRLFEAPVQHHTFTHRTVNHLQQILSSAVMTCCVGSMY